MAMNTTTASARYVPIIAALVLVGVTPPATAEHPAQARFEELVRWLPEGLPTPSEVVAFEEHRQFVYLAGRLPVKKMSKRGGGGPEPRIRLILLRPSTLVVDLGPFDAKRHDVGEPTTMAELEWPSHSRKKAKRVVCVYRSPGEETQLSMEAPNADDHGTGFMIKTGDRVYRLTLPPDLDETARITVTTANGRTVLAKRRLPDGVLPFGREGMRLLERWDSRYRANPRPRWDRESPSSHLRAAVESGQIKPGRAVVLGCGTGTNAIYLADQGFDVTAIDVSPTALDLAEEKAKQANVTVRWMLADVLAPPAGLQPFVFAFDRGCYHHVRRDNALGYVEAAKRYSHPGTQILILASNFNEPGNRGRFGVKEAELRGDFSTGFEFVKLETIRFDPADQSQEGNLAWFALIRRVTEENR
jgi:SAM-dependent methyltransferase